MNRKFKNVKVYSPSRAKRLTTSLMHEVTRLEGLPEGSFNAGMVAHGNEYLMVYRPWENGFSACVLDKKLNVIKQTQLLLEDCADPRLLWVEDKLYMIWSAIEKIKGVYPGCHAEHIRGGIVWEDGKFNPKPKSIRISPPGERQKNWIPFYQNGKFYLISTIKPHTIYTWDMKGLAEKTYEVPWLSPWFYDEFFRGNTTPILLDSGDYLSTFHTVVRFGPCHWYDNGVYVFSGQPPFKPLRCSKRSYLRAEDAIEPHFRKQGIIKVCFPVGIVRENDNLLISYGDNDSCVKILHTTISEMLATTIEL